MGENKKIPTMSIPASESTGPYVLGIDVGSTASRAGLYDSTGRPVKGSKQRIAHSFTTSYDGTSTIDAEQVVSEVRQAIDGVVSCAAKKNLSIDAVIMDSFASSLVLVDAQGKALTQVLTYADSRCAEAVTRLRESVDEKAYHARTGVRLHTSYHPARLAWLAKEHPDLLEKATKALTIGEYVYARLAGIEGIATSTAAWSGILNLHSGQLDEQILKDIGLSPSFFAPVRTPQEPAHPQATDWEVLNGLPWFHAIPDGWPSNIGPGAVDESTVAVAAATSGAMRVVLPFIPKKVPEGLWCYRLDDEHCIMGGAINDVGRAISWLERVLAPVSQEELEEKLLGSPDKQTPRVLPFFSGERATGWAADAKASFTEVSDDTTVLDMWYAVIEAIAVSYERIWEQLDEAGACANRVVASGRVTSDYPSWLQVLADALGSDVLPLEMKRATLRGTALIALEQIDPGSTRAIPPYGEAWSARAEYEEYYLKVRQDFELQYQTLVT